MSRWLCHAGLATVLCAGCGGDDRHDELEARVAQLEQNQQLVAQALERTVDKLDAFLQRLQSEDGVVPAEASAPTTAEPELEPEPEASNDDLAETVGAPPVRPAWWWRDVDGKLLLEIRYGNRRQPTTAP